MDINEYINSLGFKINPFQYTNADKEVDYLDKYFISPDYFEDVWGDPNNPVSNIVYAPRGAGKTAQRIMIEKRASKFENILSITYANHDLSQFRKISDVNISYHYTYLNRLLILSFFSKLSEMESFDYVYTFNFSERQFLYKLCRIYLFETPASFPKQAISSLKTVEDRLLDIWRNFKEPIAKVINEISKRKGVEIDLAGVEIDKKFEFTHKDNFFNILVYLKKIGIDSIYFLIDKVDEQDLTGNDPRASYQLIAPLIKDLELLETAGICFKFFLWDALKIYCAVDARPDRVFSFELKWTFNQLQEMINKRIQAYSDCKHSNFAAFFSHPKYLGRIILFSEGSPRDCIRICNTILSEQFKYNPSQKIFTDSVVNDSLDIFCKQKGLEFITNANNFKYLTKTNSVAFTIEELVVKKVAADASAIRNIINPWTTAEFLKKIGIIQKKGAKRAVNEYAFQDIRIARLACPSLNIDEFINYKVRRCNHPNCKNILYRDFDKKTYNCLECNTELN